MVTLVQKDDFVEKNRVFPLRKAFLMSREVTPTGTCSGVLLVRDRHIETNSGLDQGVYRASWFATKKLPGVPKSEVG